MLLSIITINYNDSLGLEETIKSVESQTYNDFEFIIIDGNSTDGSKDIIEKHKKSFSFCVSEDDTGVYNAMNKGIRASKGDFLFFLNSRDTFYNSNTLELVCEYLNKGLDIYYGNVVLGGKTNKKGKVIIPPKILTFDYFLKKTLPHQSTFIKKTLFDTVFYYNEDFKIVSDWEFFINAICKFNASYCHINIPISYYDGTGISSLKENNKLFSKELEISLNKHFPLFIKDYKEFKTSNDILQSNRFKMLLELEKSKISKKINSLVLRILLKLFRGKNIKEL